jgi:tetratricopeptide (TPR) repeat protein
MNNHSHPQIPESNQLQTADQLLSAGKIQQAQNLYLSIIQTHPGLAEAYFKLAWIADKEGKSLQAKKYLQKAVDKAPGNKEYLQALCTLLNKSGRQDEALRLCEQFLQKHPKHDDIHFLYASMNIGLNRIEVALSALKTSINLNPGKLPYYMKLGELLFHSGQFKDALAIYKSAYDKGLQSEGLFLNLAKLYTDFGNPDAAKSVLSRGMIFYPKTLSFPYRLQSLDASALKESFYDTLRSRIPALSEKDLFHAYWLLAQHEHSKHAGLEEMQYLLKAHQAFKMTTAFKLSSDQFMNIMNRLNQLSEQLDTAVLSPISETEAPVFIIGIPRCGSTLLENIICSGPQEMRKGEETGVIFHYAANSPQIASEENWLMFKQLCEQHYKRLGLIADGHGFTDKSLENLFMIGIILALYPKAKIIYCQRNPLACIVSILRNNLAVLPWAHDIESILRYVDLCLTTIHAARDRYGDKILTLDYEALVTDPVQQSKALMEFCNLKWDERCLSTEQRSETYSKTASHQQIRKAINTDSVNLYQAYRDIFKDLESQYSWLHPSL